MRVWERIVSAVAVAVILFGARYAYGRERLRHADLHAWYQQINQESFDGKLQDVSVEWGDLSGDDADGMTRFYNDGSATIEIDRTLTTERQAREVLRHEACHVWVRDGVRVEMHGAEFRECMRRF
jgi:predicted SprT family Zn-dependent metalloprotease